MNEWLEELPEDMIVDTEQAVDPRAYLGVGWAFPVDVDLAECAATDGTVCPIAMREYEALVAQSIAIILETGKGERVMRPDFGAGLRQLVFEPINSATIALVQHQVEDALTLFEPRIDVLSVTVAPHDSLQGVLNIDLTYRIKLTNSEQNLVYPFYLEGGGT